MNSENLESESQPPPLKRFKLLAQDTRTRTTSSARGAAVGIYAELERYTTEAGDSSCDDSLDFWNHRHQSYPLLAPLAEDLVSAPASQAYVERVFSVCGDLCARKRNRATKCLQNRVFLTMNQKLLD